MHLKILACKSQKFLGNRHLSSFHRSTTFTFPPGFVANSTIHSICDYFTAAGQIAHKITAISNYNFNFVGSRDNGYKPNILEVRHSFDFWLHFRGRQRFAGEHFAKEDDLKIGLDFIAYSVVIKLIPTWRHEIF